MSAIRVVNGVYRNKPVNNQVFNLVSGFQSGAKGSFVTVKNDGNFPNCPDTIRIRVDNISDIEYTSEMTTETAQVAEQPPVTETEEQAMDRIRERFDILHEMTKATVAGDIRAMIVSGPPGVGKSFGVEQEIEKATLFDKMAGKRLRAEVVKGSATPIGLYQTLYKYSDSNCVVVFDDCDSILLDDVALNLLKGALDSGKKRKISWLADSRILAIPNYQRDDLVSMIPSGAIADLMAGLTARGISTVFMNAAYRFSDIIEGIGKQAFPEFTYAGLNVH